ncbi:MAG: DUF2786 domain-containing protein [Actinomycetota bacterium]
MLNDASHRAADDHALVDRVRKLLDKARNTDNPHEAAAFAAKAAELVARHRIDPAQLGRSGSGRAGLGVVQLEMGRGAYTRARLALLTAIGDAHDVRVVFQAQPHGTVAFCAGHRADLDVVEVMYASLHQQAAAQMAGIRRQTGASTQQYRRSFLFGFAERIGELLTEARRKVEDRATAAAGSGASVAVALRERTERVDEFVHSEWGSVRSARRVAAVGRDGWQRGSDAADRADVGRPRLRDRRAIGPGA